MPTIDRVAGYRIYFYSSDRDEPPHVHVRRERRTAKFWLAPVRLCSVSGLAAHEVREAGRIIRARHRMYLEDWHEHFEHRDDRTSGSRAGDA